MSTIATESTLSRVSQSTVQLSNEPDRSSAISVVQKTLRSERTCNVPSLASFNWDVVLDPKNFPRTFEEGMSLVTRATVTLKEGMQKLIEVPEARRTFDNIVMAYHDEMSSFDSIQRIVKSERLIHKETPRKQELVARCIEVKDQVFSDPRILHLFVSFAEKMDQEDLLSPLEWHYLKGIFQSINDEHLSSSVRDSLHRIKRVIENRKTISFSYLSGTCAPKVIAEGSKKELSFLTVNLCIMPRATSLIYGGLIPWPVRIDAIAEELKHLNPDILFLQEVYDVHALSALQMRLGSFYAHFYGNIPARLHGFNHTSLLSSSGLAVISKFDLENLEFEPYTITTHIEPSILEQYPHGSDKLNANVFGFDRNYGIFHCDVRNGTNTLAHIATTHQNPFFANVREKQMEQCVRSFTSKAKEHAKIPFLLCGDLNIDRGDLSEGGERLIKNHFVDHHCNDGPTWHDFGNYWFHKWHGGDAGRFLNSNPRPWTVDRSLLWSDWANTNSYEAKLERIPMSNDVNRPDLALTDHHGVMTHLSLNFS